MRKDRYVLEVDKATRDYVNGLRDEHNEANPGAGWRQKDTVRYLTECHQAGIGKLADALVQETEIQQIVSARSERAT